MKTIQKNLSGYVVRVQVLEKYHEEVQKESSEEYVQLAKEYGDFRSNKGININLENAEELMRLITLRETEIEIQEEICGRGVRQSNRTRRTLLPSPKLRPLSLIRINSGTPLLPENPLERHNERCGRQIMNRV